MFRTSPNGLYPEFDFPDWKGEVYQNLDFQGVPVYLRSFKSLSFVAWPGGDSDDLVNTSRPMCVRYTKKQRFAAGTYVFRVHAYDGIRVTVDGDVKVDAVHRTQGHNRRRDFRLPLAAGEHAIIVEHTIWRADDWERGTRRNWPSRSAPMIRRLPLLRPANLTTSSSGSPTNQCTAGVGLRSAK